MRLAYVICFTVNYAMRVPQLRPATDCLSESAKIHNHEALAPSHLPDTLSMDADDIRRGANHVPAGDPGQRGGSATVCGPWAVIMVAHSARKCVARWAIARPGG